MDSAGSPCEAPKNRLARRQRRSVVGQEEGAAGREGSLPTGAPRGDNKAPATRVDISADHFRTRVRLPAPPPLIQERFQLLWGAPPLEKSPDATAMPRRSRSFTASRGTSGERCEYRIVISIVAWPISSCTALSPI